MDILHSINDVIIFIIVQILDSYLINGLNMTSSPCFKKKQNFKLSLKPSQHFTRCGVIYVPPVEKKSSLLGRILIDGCCYTTAMTVAIVVLQRTSYTLTHGDEEI